MSEADVVIIGAGLAGLSCARQLTHEGLSVQIIEAGTRVGGRVQTDVIDGFRLDHGFQVLNTAYPEVNAHLDLQALDLRTFTPGALVYKNGALRRVADPFRNPMGLGATLLAPIGGLMDKIRILSLRARARRGSIDELFARPETTSLEALQSIGFSAEMIDSFFRPFLGGIFLESELQTSSRMLDFVFRMFSQGDAALPNLGMGEIPTQLASSIPAEAFSFNSRAQSFELASLGERQRLRLENGDVIEGRAIVIATEGPEAARLCGVEAPRSRAVSCIYFKAPTPPVDEPILVLFGDKSGPINNLCVPTAVAPAYGPAGLALVSVTILGDADSGTLSAARSQLESCFGGVVDSWEVLKQQTIRHALPAQNLGWIRPKDARPFAGKGLFVCGDHRRHASIEGAMQSGREVAKNLISSLQGSSAES